MAEGGSKIVVYAAFGGNLAVAVTKFVASFYTGSSAMLSEAIHSTVDTGNQAVLLLGRRRSAHPPTPRHPFGHGMELFFWGFVVALLMFSMGGAFSIYEGWSKITNPEPISIPWVNFLVLGMSAMFEGYSLSVAYREMRQTQSDGNLLTGVQRSKDPTVFAVLLEDSAALTGLSLAAIGLGLDLWLDMPIFDGIASIAIGVLLLVTATFMANETRSLLTGESASPGIVKNVRELLTNDSRVVEVHEILSMHLGPSEILVAVTLDFEDSLPGGEMEKAAAELTQRVEQENPEVTRMFLRPNQLRKEQRPAMAN